MNLDEATHLSVATTRDGYRRAGRAWSTTPQTVAVADLTPEQIRALHDDHRIIVMPAAHPSDAEAGPAGSAASPEAAAKADPAAIDRAARIFAIEITMPAADPGRTRSGRIEVAALQGVPALADVSAAERDAHYDAFQEHLAPALAALAAPDAAETA